MERVDRKIFREIFLLLSVRYVHHYAEKLLNIILRISQTCCPAHHSSTCLLPLLLPEFEKRRVGLSKTGRAEKME